ncbi:DUF547 domain-containing protein [Maribacter algicola]|uniref:DUF547 domain-containing protein n=1 Tax=Maribacter algicola TaxID=2498892 RepID=A0A3R8R2F9_9FLAO|nr:DUF547 domain-containing protein [Maribacter algicola]RRQ50480.1 DUF547 domain-containing protein [Maribacter algicola]
MKLNVPTILLFFLLAYNLPAQELTTFFDKSDAFFKFYVKNGRVDYSAIKKNPEALRSILMEAENSSVQKSDASNYQAFWINAYNLLVLDGIVSGYPLKSPLDIPGFFDRNKHSIGGMSLTLNDIENKMLRAEFPKEARFHFVLVCAGLGCPPIIDMAYVPEKLESQLQAQTVLALNNPQFIQVNKNKVKISQIFEWYKTDFEQAGDVVDFINRYRDEKLPNNSKVSYYPYDWSLNDLN